MFGKLIQFIKTLFKKKQSDICTTVTNQPIIVENEPTTDPANAIIITQNKIYGFFAHSRNRLFTRYNLTLTYDIWQGWNDQIRTKNDNAVFICKSDTDSEIWRVWFGHQVVFVAFKEDMIVTVLPVKNQYKNLARINLRARSSSDIFTRVETCENVEKMPTSMQKYKSPKLENYKNKYVRS